MTDVLNTSSEIKYLLLCCIQLQLYQLAKITISIAENFATRKILPIPPPALMGENSIHDFFFSCVNDYMATFIILVNINSMKCFW